MTSFLTLRSYWWAIENYRPSLKQTQALTEVSDKIYAIMLKNDLNAIQINNGSVWPESLQDETFESIFAVIPESVRPAFQNASNLLSYMAI